MYDYMLFTTEGRLSKWAIRFEKNYKRNQALLKLALLALKSIVLIGLGVMVISMLVRFEIVMILSLYIAFSAFMLGGTVSEKIVINQDNHRDIRMWISMQRHICNNDLGGDLV